MKGMPAYLRRSLEMLEWVDAHQPDAAVREDRILRGTWRDLHPRWMLDGKRIRLWMQREDQPPVSVSVVAINPAPWGATIRVWKRGGPGRELRIVWDAPRMQSPSELIEPVLTWARSKWPGCRIISVGHGSDRAHTLSGAYFRIRIRQGCAEVFVMACAREGGEQQAQEILTQALLWMGLMISRKKLAGVPAMHLLVAAGHGSIVAHRARWIDPRRALLRVWEFMDRPGQAPEVKAPATPPVPVENRDFRWPVLGPFRWSSLLAKVIDLAPDAIQRYPRFREYDSLRLWGLEFARVLGPDRNRIVFGVFRQQTELTEENFADLRVLVDQIRYYRRADSPATEHPYYRVQAERWLECLILKEIEFLFPELVPGSVYPQIPVYVGKVPGRVDVLGADREGNLVVMELKVTEDPGMAMQALDYWGRVMSHNLHGDFERRGYFTGIHLSRAKPRLYLVAPIFAYHDSFDRVLRFLDPSLQVTKISTNEDWRCGVKILRRRDYRRGEIS